MEINESNKILVENLYNTIIAKPAHKVIKESAFRHNKVKIRALGDLIVLANKFFGAKFRQSNKSCPSCVKNVLNLVKRKIEEWQTDKK